MSKFDQLAATLANRPGVTNPKGLAYVLGARKFGKAGMAAKAKHGRHKHALAKAAAGKPAAGRPSLRTFETQVARNVGARPSGSQPPLSSAEIASSARAYKKAYKR